MTHYRFTPALAVEILDAMAREGLSHYRIGFGADRELQAAITAAINQGIDAHLEAVAFVEGSEDRGLYMGSTVSVTAETLPVLVRRLAEPLPRHWDLLVEGTDECLGEVMQRLAAEILGTLEIAAEFS